MKFLVDMPLPPHLAKWLRESGHDAVHASELGLSQAPDIDILVHAQKEARIVITADLDYPRLLALAMRTEPGLILFRDGVWGGPELIQRLDEILRSLTPAEIQQSIIVVDHDRVRRRRLPIGPQA